MNQEMISLARGMYGYGFSYSDIQQEIYKKFGELIHTDTIRYHVYRKDQKKIDKVDKLEQEGIEKILVLSDLHIPYQCEQILDIVKKHKDEISTLVLNGDVIDCYAISSFPKLDPKPLSTEMAACHLVLKQIQDILPKTKKIIILGNHEIRFEKYLGNNSSEVNNLHSSNIMKEIVRGFEVHDRRLGTVTTHEELDYLVVDNWYYQINDCIFAHPTSFSRVSAKTAQMALEYFVESGANFNACIIAHTHKIASCFKFGKFSVEQGCLCLPQGYASSGKLTYTQQQNGYHLAVFKDGKYNFNLSKQYILD